MVKLSDRRKYLFKYAFMFMAFLSLMGVVMGCIFLLSNIFDGPETLNYLHGANCQINSIGSINNMCPVQSEEFGLSYKLEWEPCILKEFNITHDAKVDVNCTWVYPQAFPDEKQAIIQIRREFNIGDTYKCVVDEINNYCYPDNNALALEITVIAIPGIMMIIFGMVAYYLNNNRKPLEINDKDEDEDEDEADLNITKPEAKTKTRRFFSCFKGDVKESEPESEPLSKTGDSKMRFTKLNKNKMKQREKNASLYVTSDKSDQEDTNSNESISYLNTSNNSEQKTKQVEQDKYVDVLL
jgi:hypothetical protein